MKPPLAIWLLLIFVVGCSERSTPPPETRVVKAITIDTAGQNNAQSRSFGGDVRARHETLVGFRVGGKLSERLVDVGSHVKPGQPLARIDVADLALNVSQADAQAAFASADEKRYRDLRDRNFVSQAALDAREAARKTASAQAALARNQAGYSTLRADKAGVVTEVLAQPGQVVAAGQGVFRMAWDGEREVAISIPEDMVASIKEGTEAEIVSWSSTGKKYRGRVREVAPMADPATRTYAVRVSILDTAAFPLGLSVAVSFRIQKSSTIKVPMTALFQQGDQPAVWVIGNDSKLVLRPIGVAKYGDDGVYVSEGVAAGERIVVAGVSRLHAGEKVAVAETENKPGMQSGSPRSTVKP